VISVLTEGIGPSAYGVAHLTPKIGCAIGYRSAATYSREVAYPPTGQTGRFSWMNR